MLGELIFESKGKITGQRVLSVENGTPKLEVSVSGTGIFNGNVDVTSYGEGNYLLNITGKILHSH